VPDNDLDENTISNAPNETGTTSIAAAPGAPGGGDAQSGDQGSWKSAPGAGETFDDYDSGNTKGVSGAGGAGENSADNSEVLRPGAGDGEIGGNAISVYNPLGITSGGVAVGAWATGGTYASDWTSNWPEGRGGPELIINNKSGGYIRGGGGGGGGGGAQYNAGGAGGECGESGSPGFGPTTGVDHRGAAGAGGKAVGTDWTGTSLGWDHSAGKITKNNDNTDEYSFYGSDGEVPS